MQNLSVSDLKQRLSAGGLTVLDVRTDEELVLAAFPGAVHIPLHQLAGRLEELNPAQPIAVLCHHGSRSEMAARLLERSGFAAVSNVTGGIDAWSAQVDSTIPRY